ncbi:MAG: hypothetical protein CMJ78_12815 [Planctomycetaceae bacterium]|nr:hypothetical protein [Planctomycetaceae bacterium]
MLTDELPLPDIAVKTCHPMDSSRVLLGLLMLSEQAVETQDAALESETLDNVVSKGVFRSLFSALHFRDVSTVRHARRVAMLSVGMAQHLGWDGRQLKVLEVAALLHDIGKLGVPDSILYKPGSLSPDETELMALHCGIGIDVLQACRVDQGVLEMIAQSNTHFSANRQLSRRLGNTLNQGARILAIADAYDSLATDQVYREAKPHVEIMSILMDSAGSQFDGNIVSAMARWMEQSGVPFQPDTEMNIAPRNSTRLSEELEASSLCHIFSYLYLLERLYDGFYLINSDGRFVVWNGGAQELFGYDAQELLQQRWADGALAYRDKYDEEKPIDQLPLASVVRTGRPQTSQMKVQQKDGGWLFVELQTVPIVDHQGELKGVAEIFRDIERGGRRSGEYRELKLAASRDALTNVANRGELETQLAVALAEYSKHPKADPFSVIFLDVDHFKSVNDTHGHAVGDQVLIGMAKLLQHEMYSGELVARYGGEEFVVICPDTPMSQALSRAERLRLAVANAKLSEVDDLKVTSSFGVTVVEPGDSVESILRRADKALYLSKENGRNQTTSLTNEQFNTDVVPEKKSEPTDNRCVTESFLACIAADMIVYKLGGFVQGQKAKLLDVNDNCARFRIGKRRLLSRFTSKRRPVDVKITFGDSSQSKRGRPLVQVDVEIRPVGRVGAEKFQLNAREALKSLKSYFAAEKCES